MILTDVLTATDLNPMYYKFIPVFIKAWRKLFPEINIHIVLIATEIIEELKPYEEYIKLFSPIEGIKTAFIAQNIRLFYPALIDASGGVIISDMDMIPMGRSFYIDPIKDITDEKFVCYRPLDCVGPNEMVICYNIARPDIWKEVFNIHSIVDVRDALIKNYGLYVGERISHMPNYGHNHKGWIGDQLYLYKRTQEWNKETNNLIILNNQIHVIRNSGSVPDIKNAYYRLWMQFPKVIQQIIKDDRMSDFHMPRPYGGENKNIIDMVVGVLDFGK
jgi:hypothetical protein